MSPTSHLYCVCVHARRHILQRISPYAHTDAHAQHTGTDTRAQARKEWGHRVDNVQETVKVSENNESNAFETSKGTSPYSETRRYRSPCAGLKYSVLTVHPQCAPLSAEHWNCSMLQQSKRSSFSQSHAQVKLQYVTLRKSKNSSDREL